MDLKDFHWLILFNPTALPGFAGFHSSATPLRSPIIIHVQQDCCCVISCLIFHFAAKKSCSAMNASVMEPNLDVTGVYLDAG